MLLPSVSGAVFLKKSTFSFLRPLDPLEHMTLSSDYADKDQFINFALFSEGKNGCSITFLEKVTLSSVFVM